MLEKFESINSLKLYINFLNFYCLLFPYTYFSSFNYIFMHVILFFYWTWKWPLTSRNTVCYSATFYYEINVRKFAFLLKIFNGFSSTTVFIFVAKSHIHVQLPIYLYKLMVFNLLLYHCTALMILLVIVVLNWCYVW